MYEKTEGLFMSKMPKILPINPKIYGVRNLTPVKNYTKPLLKPSEENLKRFEEYTKQINEYKTKIAALEKEIRLPDYSPAAKIEPYRALNTLKIEMYSLMDELRELKTIIYAKQLKNNP